MQILIMSGSELVASPEEFLYSLARDYSGEKGLVSIELVYIQRLTGSQILN